MSDTYSGIPDAAPGETIGHSSLNSDRNQEPASYTPSPDERKAVSEVERKFEAWRRDRHNQEPQWFVNAAFFRGQHNVHWSAIENRLITAPVLHPQRTRKSINRIFAKIRARRAKFLKNRPTWVVVPASTELQAKIDARATGKVLDYVWRKLHLEQKYRRAVEWAETCSKGFWWFNWDPEAIGRVTQVDPLSGAKHVQEAVVGEVVVEVGSPFEVLVGTLSGSSFADQDEIIRAKERTLEYVRSRYPDKGQFVAADGATDTFQYEQRIANLNPSAGLFGTSSTSSNERYRDADGAPRAVVVKEYFRRPDGDYPKGLYRVVANSVLLKETELPFGFWDMENPFPCVEFPDVTNAGQYWGTTVLEQLVELQREYNGVRNMISTQIKLMGHPKILVAKQHQLSDGAWTPDAGEIVEYNARPGIPAPEPWLPPNIIGDAWRVVDLIRQEFDDITQIYPSAEGKTGAAQSGFQTNLLQEAADTVHAPDIRQHELAIEEAAYKIRRIIKQGYSIPRLITVTSAAYDPEIFEFSAEDVDEYADIVVQAGSALPQLKGARIQSVLDLYAKGVLGDPADPQVRKKVLNVLDLGGLDDILDYNRVDDDMINIENAEAEDGQPLAAPRFYENHNAHWQGHVDKLKSPAVMNWPSPNRMGLLAHAIQHAMYVNHAAAFQMAQEAGLNGLVPPPPPLNMPFGPGAPGSGAGPTPGMPLGGPQDAPGGSAGSPPGSPPSPPPQAQPGPTSQAPPGGPPQAQPDHSFAEATRATPGQA